MDAVLTAPDLPIESTDALDRAGHMSRMKIEDIDEISDFFNTSVSIGDTENLISSYYSEQQQEAITSSIVESVIESFAPTGTVAVMRSDMEVEKEKNDGDDKIGAEILIGLWFHYQFGKNKDFIVDANSLDFTYTSQMELKITNPQIGESYYVNLFDAGINPYSLAFGVLK